MNIIYFEYISLLFQFEGHSEGNLNLLDVHLLVSLFFVIATMIEFAVVLMIARLSGSNPENWQNKACQCQSHLVQIWDQLRYTDTFRNHAKFENENHKKEGIYENGNQLDREAVLNFKATWYSKTDVIDFAAFLVFFLAYFIFNLIYMTHYM